MLFRCRTCRASVATFRLIAKSTQSSTAGTRVSIIGLRTTTPSLGATVNQRPFAVATTSSHSAVPQTITTCRPALLRVRNSAIRKASLSDTHTFSSRVINDARFGATRVEIGIFNTGVNGTGGFSPTVSADLGARGINLDPNSSGIILFGIVDNLNNEDRAVEFTGAGGPFYFTSNNFNFADTVTVVHGNSTFKFGGDLRVRQNSNFDGGRLGGTKTNTQYGTTGSGFVSGNYNGIGPNDTGSSVANFLRSGEQHP